MTSEETRMRLGMILALATFACSFVAPPADAGLIGEGAAIAYVAWQLR